MKKLLSLLLSLLFIFSIIPINAFAIENDNFSGIDISQYTDSELDLTQFTMEDILNMTAEEYLELVAEFERVYDPYNSYDETESMSENLSTLSSERGTISPQWTSGDIDDDYTEAGTHEYISGMACIILNNDKGFYANNAGEQIVIMLSISLSSLLPDYDETSGVFAGHFYDPDTGNSYNLSDSNTAKKNALNHYNAAVNAAKVGAMDQAYEHLGRCLHYVQDVNVPHHAANIISKGPLSSHYQFEHFAFENMESYLGNYTTISSVNYLTASFWGVDTITHKGAAEAKPMSEYVKNVLDKSKWSEYAKKSMQNAARYSAMVLYKFGRESAVPFYSN